MEIGQEELHGVGLFDPIVAKVGDAHLVDITARPAADLVVNIMEKTLGRGAPIQGGQGHEIVGPTLATIEVALGHGEEAVDVDGEGDGGVVFVIDGLGNAQIGSRVAIGEMARAQGRKGMEGVGGVVDAEVDGDLGDGEVVDDGVEFERTVRARLEASESLLLTKPIVEAVMSHAVGHVDITVPPTGETAGAACVGERDGGIAVGGCEGAGLIAAVEG